MEKRKLIRDDGRYVLLYNDDHTKPAQAKSGSEAVTATPSKQPAKDRK